MSRFVLLAVLVSLLFSAITADIPGDLITSLPGYGKTPTKQYSGFLPVDANQTLFLHYWFVTSSGDPSKDPVAIWMNGGPGCSSIGGFLTELGPFSFTGETDSTGLPTLQDNPYGWTTVSSVLFLEQPAGVGYSYAVNGSMTSDDFIQSQNTYGFLLNWFKAFPEFSTQDFFITGESYAGIYVPTLANRIVDGNAAGMPYVNLKGIAVGDGCIGNSVGTCGDGPDGLQIEFDLFYGHGMISQTAKESVYALCGNWIDISQDCENAAYNAIGNVGNINIYDVYDTCPGFSSSSLRKKSHPALGGKPVMHAPNRVLSEHVEDPVYCIPDGSSDFMNNDAVKKALHVDKAPVSTWSDCSGIDYTDNLVSLLPTYPKLISNMNVLIYSGDADACVPWNGSYNWTRNLGFEETLPWQPWMVSAEGRSWTGTPHRTQLSSTHSHRTVQPLISLAGCCFRLFPLS